MALQLQFSALLGFAGLMSLAAFEDLRRLLIPNALTLSMCALWPLYVAATPSPVIILGSLGCAAAVFLAGAFCFSRGYLGGGDVKLLAVGTLWAGPSATPALLVLTGVLGGMLALFLLLPPGAYVTAIARAKLGPDSAQTKIGTGTPVPYGIAIAAASVLVIFLPHIH